MREVIVGLLQSCPALEVVGAAGDGDEGVEQARLLNPDVVLTDIRMPRKNGFEVTRTIKALPHPPKVVVVSADDSPAHRGAADAAGADVFCSKLHLATQLLPTVLGFFPSDKASSRDH